MGLPTEMFEGIKPEPLCHTQIFEFLAWTSHRKKTPLFTQPCPKYLWELDIIIPLSWGLWPRKRSQKSAHILQRLPPSFQPHLFFFLAVTKTHIGNVLNQPRSEKQRTDICKTLTRKPPENGDCLKKCLLPHRFSLNIVGRHKDLVQPSPLASKILGTLSKMWHSQRNRKRGYKAFIKHCHHHRKWEILK